MCAPSRAQSVFGQRRSNSVLEMASNAQRNAYLTTDDSRLVFGPGAALIRGLTTVSISRPQFSHDQT